LTHLHFLLLEHQPRDEHARAVNVLVDHFGSLERVACSGQFNTGEVLPAGALLGSGTVGRGCGMELGKYIKPGDTVELEIAGIGVLRNTIGQPPNEGWLPTPKQPTLVNADD
jgi:Fumarylacetoacetate (FAA) hydrolase family